MPSASACFLSFSSSRQPSCRNIVMSCVQPRNSFAYDSGLCPDTISASLLPVASCPSQYGQCHAPCPSNFWKLFILGLTSSMPVAIIKYFARKVLPPVLTTKYRLCFLALLTLLLIVVTDFLYFSTSFDTFLSSAFGETFSKPK